MSESIAIIISILFLMIVVSVIGIIWHVKLAERLKINAQAVDFSDWLFSGLAAHVLAPITVICIIISIIAIFA